MAEVAWFRRTFLDKACVLLTLLLLAQGSGAARVVQPAGVIVVHPTVYPGEEPVAPYYPGGCLEMPLPNPPPGLERIPAVMQRGGEFTADAWLSIWRHSCEPQVAADGTSEHRSVLLMQMGVPDAWLERGSGYDYRDTGYPIHMPDLFVKTGAATFAPLRLEREPYMLFGNSAHLPPFGVGGRSDTTYVIERASGIEDPIDFDSALSILAIAERSVWSVAVSVGAHAATQKNSLVGVEPLPVTGAVNGIYMDPEHSGEGLNIQVLQSDGRRILDVAWFTYDPTGRPFWLGGSVRLDEGDRHVGLDLFYTDGGGFAGDFGNDVDRHAWGRLEINFGSCQEVTFRFAARAGLPAHVPSGDGAKTWLRLARTGSAPC